jgi:uncharacterized DUF497 family protein
VFDWDDANIDHIAAHGVELEEVEEVLLDPRRIGAPARNTAGEQRWAVIGATEEGRVLLVVFTRRGELARVITARDANRAQKRRYRGK